MKISKLLLILLLFKPISINSFNTLTDLQKYAAGYPDAPKSDNADWIDPQFFSFYKKYFTLSWFESFLIKLGLKKHTGWDDKVFSQLIDTLIAYRKNNKFKSPFDKEITLPPQSRVMIWGDLHGAFHSLVRDLTYLEQSHIINKNLKILRNNVYFVFNGDVVSRSPYSLETMQIIALLMKKNLDKVFYIKGNHESKGFWENFSMRRTLLFREGQLSLEAYEHLPLGKKINAFFNTLPDSLIIKDLKNKNKKIIIASHTIKPSYINSINTKLILLGEQRLEVHKASKGLEFLGYLGGAAKWSILSCPIEAYQTFFNFFFDSFTELTIGETIDESVLTLYNRHIKGKKDFNRSYYNPIFGYELASKHSHIKKKKLIKIGSSMSLTGITGPLGTEVKAGLQAAILNYNKPTNTFLIKPTILNDGYIPRRSLRNMKNLINNFGIDTFIIPTGTPTILIYLKMIESGEIAVLFPYTGTGLIRKPHLKNVINFRPSYTKEIRQSIQYLIEHHGVKNFAFFYQNDPYGKPIADAAHAELKEHGITQWLDLPHLGTQTDYSKLIDKLKAFSPSAIGCFASHFPTQEFVNQLETDFLVGRTLFGISFLYSETFQRFLDRKGIPFVVSSAVPNPKTSNLEIAKNYLKTCKTQGLVPSLNSFEGYIAGTLFAHATKKVKPPFTKEKILRFFEGLNNYKFQGLTLTFNPQTRDLSQPVWIRSFENKWVPIESEDYQDVDQKTTTKKEKTKIIKNVPGKIAIKIRPKKEKISPPVPTLEGIMPPRPKARSRQSI